jgi:putative endonuclease
MVCLYILENKKGKHYIGITSQSPQERLLKHNKGEVFSTKFFLPWEVVYLESYNTYKEARLREKQIKSWHGGNAFKKLLGRSARSANGRQTGSEPVNLGSNPSLAALPRRKNLAG